MSSESPLTAGDDLGNYATLSGTPESPTRQEKFVGATTWRIRNHLVDYLRDPASLAPRVTYLVILVAVMGYHWGETTRPTEDLIDSDTTKMIMKFRNPAFLWFGTVALLPIFALEAIARRLSKALKEPEADRLEVLLALVVSEVVLNCSLCLIATPVYVRVLTIHRQVLYSCLACLNTALFTVSSIALSLFLSRDANMTVTLGYYLASYYASGFIVDLKHVNPSSKWLTYLSAGHYNYDIFLRTRDGRAIDDPPGGRGRVVDRMTETETPPPRAQVDRPWLRGDSRRGSADHGRD